MIEAAGHVAGSQRDATSTTAVGRREILLTLPETSCNSWWRIAEASSGSRSATWNVGHVSVRRGTIARPKIDTNLFLRALFTPKSQRLLKFSEFFFSSLSLSLLIKCFFCFFFNPCNCNDLKFFQLCCCCCRELGFNCG